MRRSKFPSCALALFVGVVWTLIGVNAFADSVQFDLNKANISNDGPYIGITVDLTSPTTAVITAQSLTNGGYSYYFGSGFGIYETASVAVSNVFVSVGGGYTGTGYNVSDQFDGFGKFNTVLSFDNNGPSGSISYLQFTLTNTSGSWAGAGDVLAANANGWLASTHIFPNDGSFDGLNTGFAAGPGGGDGTVPEPATLLLLGAGIAGIGVRRVKRKR